MEPSLEDIIRNKAQILSSVTGLPIKHEKFVNLQADVFLNEMGDKIVPMSYTLVLGDNIEEYSLSCSVHYRYEGSYFIPSIQWGVAFNGKSFSSASHTLMSGKSPDSILETEKTQKDGIRLINRDLGGVSVDHGGAFMNYENFTLESINGKDSYFQNMYLAVMTHLKERNIALPPILSKDDNIRHHMENGNVEELEKVLNTIFSEGFEAQSERFLLHMQAEANEIRGYTQEKNDEMNPLIHIREKISAEESILPGECLPKYNILVVENEMGSYKEFTKYVCDMLEKNGQFGGSSVFSEFNLPCCMQACETGQIDFVLFNWTNPSHEEAMMFDIEIDEDNKTQTYELDGGNIFSSEKSFNAWKQILEIKSKRIGIRNKWMEMIKQTCERKGVPIPPYYIVETPHEYNHVDEIVGAFVDNMKERHVNGCSDSVN